MYMFLASDFPNLPTYIVGLPLLLLSIVVGSVCIHNRWRAVAICFGLACVLVGGLLYLTVAYSGKDYMLTAIVACALFVTGIMLLVAKREDEHDDDAAS